MDCSILQPEYIVVSREYEVALHEGHSAQLKAAQYGAEKKFTRLREQHAEELSRRDLELTLCKEECQTYKQEVYAWRQKAVLYKMKLASAQESAQLLQHSLGVSEGVVASLTEERETLLRCNNSLQEQLRAITALCQGQHRAAVEQQGQLASTSAETQQLQAQLLQTHGLSEALAQQLAGERVSLEAARHQADVLRDELASSRAELEAQMASCSALKAQCSQVQAALDSEKDVRVAAEARIAKLQNELVLRGEELEAAEQRLTRHMNGTAVRDEHLVQETQRLKAADDAIIQELRYCIDQLKQRLADTRRESDEELRRQEAKLERETRLREKLEGESEQHRRLLMDEQDSHSAALAQLRRQVAERVADVELLQDKLTAAEKKATTRAAQLSELEAALQLSSQQLGQQVSSKDTAMAAWQGQLEHERRKLEQVEAELRAAQAAHARQVEQLQKRLAEQESYAREQEAQLRQQLEATRRQMLDAGNAGAHAQQLVSELQGAVVQREDRLRQLQNGAAADLAQRDERIRALQTDHVSEVAPLRARIREIEGQLALQADHASEVASLRARMRELERQLASSGSPTGPQRQQARDAAAAVDKLMGNLLGAGGGGGADGAMSDDEDSGGPSAERILAMSQQPISQGQQRGQQRSTAAQPLDARTSATMVEVPPSATAEAAEYGAGPSGAGEAANAGAAAKAVHVTIKPGAAKRTRGQAADGEDRPAGRGRARKAAKASENQDMPVTAVNGAPEPRPSEVAQARADSAEKEIDVVAELPAADTAPSGRYASRRRAAQSGQARAKAMAAALAESDTEAADADTPGYALKAPKAQKGKGGGSQRQPAVAEEKQDATAEAGPSVGPPAEPQSAGAAAAQPTAKGRGKRGKGSQAQVAVSAAQAQEDPLAGSVGLAPAVVGGVAVPAAAAEPVPLGALQGALADGGTRGPQEHAALPPQAEAGPLGAHPAAMGAAEAVAATRGVERMASQHPTQQHQSQPATQPQPPLAQPPPPPLFTASQQQGFSQASLFSQRRPAPSMKLPLGIFNFRALEEARSRAKLIPAGALQLTKPVAKVAPPSSVKRPATSQAMGAKGPLPKLTAKQLAAPAPSVVPGEAMPPDMLMRSLQKPPVRSAAR